MSHRANIETCKTGLTGSNALTDLPSLSANYRDSLIYPWTLKQRDGVEDLRYSVRSKSTAY